jgi:hypothetical protein
VVTRVLVAVVRTVEFVKTPVEVPTIGGPVTIGADGATGGAETDGTGTTGGTSETALLATGGMLETTTLLGTPGLVAGTVISGMETAGVVAGGACS